MNPYSRYMGENATHAGLCHVLGGRHGARALTVLLLCVSKFAGRPRAASTERASCWRWVRASEGAGGVGSKSEVASNLEMSENIVAC